LFLDCAARAKKRNSADLGYFVEQAEKQTKIRQQQVSKWNSRLKDVQAYAEILYPRPRPPKSSAASL
jgi:hypothetical protein